MGELDKDYKKLKELAYGIIILAVLLLIAFLKMGTTSFVVAIPIYLLFRFKYHIRFYKIFIGVHLVFTAMYFWVTFFSDYSKPDPSVYNKLDRATLEDVRCNETIGLINYYIGGAIPCWYPEDIFSKNNPDRAIGLIYKVNQDVEFFWVNSISTLYEFVEADVDEVSPAIPPNAPNYDQLSQIIYKKPKYQKLTQPLSNPLYGFIGMIFMLIYYAFRENT